MYIPYGHQSITEEDIQAVVDVLRSDYLTTGPAIGEFEQKAADYVGAKYAVAVSNGTAALHIACLAAGIAPGDEVITFAPYFLEYNSYRLTVCCTAAGGRYLQILTP